MFRNSHPEARRQQQLVTPLHSPLRNRVLVNGAIGIAIDWADRLIHPRWIHGWMANGRAPRQRCGQRVSVVEQDTRSRSTSALLNTTHGLALTAVFPTAGLKTQLYLPHGASATIRRVRRAAPQQHIPIDTQTAPTAAQANKPMAAQLVPALRESSSHLCRSCSHTRPCIWRPILVHELCHAATLKHSHESTPLHLSA